MPSPRVSTTGARARPSGRKGRRYWRWLAPLLIVLVVPAGLIGWRLATAEPAPIEPPEAGRVLAAQEMTGNFGILIPGYLPKGFKRAEVEIEVTQEGPAGEPSVKMAYRHPKGATVFLHQWVPANRDLEMLANSRPIETKWGKGLLLTQSDQLIALWVDVGALRVSIYTRDLKYMSREQLVLAANTLGLASDLQVYSFATEMPEIHGLEPPPPFEVPINENGIQEINLTITPGGYDPMRFSVKSGITVKLNFRALGEVGCGVYMDFPADPANRTGVQLTKEEPVQVLEFIPQVPGNHVYRCTNNCFRGIMTVLE